MAVPKKKKSFSKKKLKIANKKIKNISLSIDKETFELHLRHHITYNNYYRGKKIINLN